MSVYGFDLYLPDVKELSREVLSEISEETNDGATIRVVNRRCIASFSREAKSRSDAVALAIHQVAKAGYISFLEDIKPIKEQPNESKNGV